MALRLLAITVAFLAGLGSNSVGSQTLDAHAPVRSSAWIVSLGEASYPEGPLWTNGALLFAEMGSDQIRRWDGRNLSVFWARKGCGPTAIASYGQLGFLVLCHLEGSVIHLSEDGATIKVITEASAGVSFTNPNDCHYDGWGGVFFSDPGYFNKSAPARGRVWHIDSTGKVQLLADRLRYPNGVYFHQPSMTLFVSEHLARRVLRYSFDQTGRLAGVEVFADFDKLPSQGKFGYPEAGPDGIEIDDDGNVWVAEYGEGRVHVFRLSGELITTLYVPMQYVTNVAVSSDGVVAVTGAHENDKPPFRGSVLLGNRGELISR